mgnify:FL=1
MDQESLRLLDDLNDRDPICVETHTGDMWQGSYGGIVGRDVWVCRNLPDHPPWFMGNRVCHGVALCEVASIRLATITTCEDERI